METRSMLIGGRTYRVSSDDQYLAAMGADFEPHMVQLFRALIRPDDVVADIGANIGLTALLFSKMARQVYAFEPSPSTFQILRSNLTTNEVQNVEAVNLGLGQKAETLTITFAKNNRSGGFVSEKICLEEGHQSEDIRIDTLDNFFGGERLAPSFLKIDVEGFEQNVVRGGEGFLAKHQPTVVMEMNHFCLDVLQRITIPDFLDFMRSVFPVLYAVDSDNATIIDLHVPHKAYFVMHEHVVRQRFPNLVGGFTPDIKPRLDALATQVAGDAAIVRRLQSAVCEVMAKPVQGPAFDTPVTSTISGSLSTKSAPTTLLPGALIEIPVMLDNQSTSTWYGYGSHPVLLSYHWLNPDGSMCLYDGLRTPLACEALQAGEKAEELINVQAPSACGKYRLILTLVQEGVCWFEDRGFIPAKMDVVIE